MLILTDETDNEGDFTISYQYNDRDPEAVIAAMTPEQRQAYYATRPIVDEEKVSETNTFWFFIAGGVGGVILIVILIVCLVKMKKRNDLIVAKVEKLTSVQLEKSDYIPDE